MGRSLLSAFFLLIATLAPCHAVDLPALQQPSWKELSTEQQQILAPLADDWNQMDSLKRKKWVGIAARYPKMSPEEQERIQGQMGNWAKLTPQQRKIAREKYKNLNKATPEQKANLKQQWALYKELPDDEKKRLQAEAKVRAPAKGKIGATLPQKPLRPMEGMKLYEAREAAAAQTPAAIKTAPRAAPTRAVPAIKLKKTTTAL